MFMIRNQNPLEENLECLVVGLIDQPEKFSGKLQKLDEQFNGQLTELVKSGDITANLHSVSVIHSLGNTGIKRLVFIGLGKEKVLKHEDLREAVGKASKKLTSFRVNEVGIALDSFETFHISKEDAARTLSEAFVLATYEFVNYKQKSNEPESKIGNVYLYTEGDREKLSTQVVIGEAMGNGTNSARTLVNLPGNMLKASDLATYSKNLAGKYGFEVEILEKKDLEKLGMGAFLAVNQGSEEPPYMITLKYQGKEEWTDVLGLVGKGITFDTGGYSIKPKDGIVGMKTDMGGAAAVLGAMEIIGETKPAQNVIAVIPSTDNMISGAAMKPDDVITSLSGKTIEVLNTDAEGRLVLADAIVYAKHHGANYLIDVATLTGGVIVALGVDKTGALTNNNDLFEELLNASHETGEFIWQLPYTEKDRERVRNSKIADLNNSPGREGHAIMGGAFIGEFTDGTPWVHLDIAGTATTNKHHSLGPAGATGVMARTLAQFVMNF